MSCLESNFTMEEVVVKLSFLDATIKTRLSCSEATLDSLKKIFFGSGMVENASIEAKFKFRYLDDDGAMVDLLTDKDVQEAVIQHKQLRVFVSEYSRTVSYLGTLPVDPLAQSILQEISVAHQTVAQQVVAWWFRKMPEAYFREIDQETRMSHLRALIALRMAEQRQEVTLFTKDKGRCTVIKPNNYVGLLAEVIESLPKDRQLREANIYTSVDGDLVVDVFEFEQPVKQASKKMDLDEHQELVAEIRRAFLGTQFKQEEVDKFLRACDASYVVNVSVNDIIEHFKLVKESHEKSTITVRIEKYSKEDVSNEPGGIFAIDNIMNHNSSSKLSTITVVLMTNAGDDLFIRVVKHLSRNRIDILKAALNRVDDFQRSNFLMLTTLVQFQQPHDKIVQEIRSELRRLPYLDQLVFRWAEVHKQYSITEAETVVAIGKLVHCLLSSTRPLVYTMYHIDQFCKQHPDIVKKLLQVWMVKFDPLYDPSASLDSRRANVEILQHETKQLIEEQVDLTEAQIFFTMALSVITEAVKVNFYCPDRTSFSIRLKSSIFAIRKALLSEHDDNYDCEEQPHALFYSIGRGYVAFHIRFLDIARGGMRILLPSSIEEHSIATRELVSECLHLAKAQHLKNKDIPEGGAKAVILVRPGSTTPQDAALAFTDGLLDLTVIETIQSSSKGTKIIDYLDENELIYLGPDDNVTNDIITAICNRAVYRAHPFPNAFMSSKPGAGINHKQYGVTAQGICVFLDVALHHLKLLETKAYFTVKITGDFVRDLVSHLVKILFQTYGERCKIVAISDESGVVEDELGLEYDELFRLFAEDESLSSFLPQKLSSKGTLVPVVENQGLGMRSRSSFPFRVEADVFIPAGGRPNTINDANWKMFIDKTSGEPKSGLIIEAANLYISSIARTRLSEKGVTIIKDSSATKCGVICSAYEILAGMLLNEKEFLSIKENYVQEVLVRLRHFAHLEGELLFKEYRKQNGAVKKSLDEISIAISQAILRVKEAIMNSDVLSEYVKPFMTIEPSRSRRASSFFIESSPPSSAEIELKSPLASNHHIHYNMDYHKACRGLLLQYFPPSLRSSSNVQQRFDKTLPLVFLKRILATALACKIVYHEGLSFVHLENEKMAEWAFNYIVEFDKTVEMIRHVRHASDLSQTMKERIMRVLELGGTRLGIELLQQ